MKLYEKYWSSNYEELITYYPRFYRDVLEMEAILKAHGGIADDLEANIEQVYLNNFIDYADEGTIESLEAFLKIGLNKQRTLEERRRLVKSFFVGFGKVSATMLEEMIESYTGAEVKSRFEISDEEGNNTLYLDFERGDVETLYMSDIMFLLSKKIPAHIKWKAAVTYRHPVGVGVRRSYYRIDYELCGTKPEIALQGALRGVRAATEARRTHARTNYPSAEENGLRSGNKPSDSTLGDRNVIGAGAEAKAESFGVDYIYCGTRLAQS